MREHLASFREYLASFLEYSGNVQGIFAGGHGRRIIKNHKTPKPQNPKLKNSKP
jgi:hypothetical protein